MLGRSDLVKSWLKKDTDELIQTYGHLAWSSFGKMFDPNKKKDGDDGDIDNGEGEDNGDDDGYGYDAQ